MAPREAERYEGWVRSVSLYRSILRVGEKERVERARSRREGKKGEGRNALDISAQRPLANAIAMEIILILLNVVEDLISARASVSLALNLLETRARAP